MSAPALFPLFHRQAHIGGSQESRWLSILHLDQPGRLGPRRFIVRGCSGLVGIGEILAVEALVFDDPLNHSHGDGSNAVRPDRQPLPGPGCSLGASGIDHGDLQSPVDQALGNLLSPQRRTVVGFIGAGTLLLGLI